VRYQALTTPTFGAPAQRRDDLAHDIAGWRALAVADDAPAVPRRPTRLTWTTAPALATSSDLRAFVTAYLNLVRARRPTGRLVIAHGRVRRGAPPGRRRGRPVPQRGKASRA
jgi:hypothetical protein